MEQSLKAKYRAHNNLYVVCYLDIIDATSKGFKAQVGIRAPGDTIIPVGSKLYLASTEVRRPTQEGHGDIDLFYVVVEGVEIDYGTPIQVCSPICREKRPDMREVERKWAEFNVNIKEMEDASFTVINGSVKGLTLLYQSSNLFVGLVLGNQYNIEIPLKEENFSFPGEISHIHYDWHSYQHMLGIKILKLTQNQEFILNHILDPNYTVQIKQTSTIDTEEAKIRKD